MKLIIDIDDEEYNSFKKAEIKGYVSTQIPISTILNGVPPIDVLNKIRAEIEQGYCKVENDYDKGRNMGLNIAMQIIDKYKGGDEK